MKYSQTYQAELFDIKEEVKDQIENLQYMQQVLSENQTEKEKQIKDA